MGAADKPAANAGPTLLIITMGLDYIAPARMPRELQRAGFRVAMLAPRNSLAAQTAYVDQVGYFPADVRLHEWIGIVAGTLHAVNPALILPGDDVTVRTLVQLVLDPPKGLRPEIQRVLGDVIRRSLGDPSGWIDSIDKARMFELAGRSGIAVATGGIANNEEEAIAIAADIGYPVIVRQSYGSAGHGTARCASAVEIRKAFASFPPQNAWQPQGVQRFVVQRFLDGDVVNRASLAWDGIEVAGFTRGRLATYPDSLGPASVVEFLGNAEVTAATRSLFKLVGMHGLVGTQFILQARTRVPYLIEVNRRMLPATHCGSTVGVDLAAALFAMVNGTPWTGPTDLAAGPGTRVALFPQEWYRDANSAWLRTLPSDAPWDDPQLLAAMFRMPFAV